MAQTLYLRQAEAKILVDLLKAYADAAGQSAVYNDAEVKRLIGVNTAAIETLNGSGDGSVDKKISDAINTFATQISDDDVVNSFKELVDWVATHGSEASTMAGQIANHGTAITALEKKTGTLPEGQTDLITYLKAYAESVVANADLSQYATNTALNAAVDRIAANEGDIADLQAADTTNLTAAKSYTDTEVKKVADDLSGYKTTNDAAVAAAKKAGTDAQADVDALEILVGEVPASVGDTATSTVIGYVNAKVAATNGDVSGLTTRMGQAESDIDALEGRADALETKTAIPADAAQTTLAAYADAKASAAQTAAASDATSKANQALEDAKTYCDGKVDGKFDTLGSAAAVQGETESTVADAMAAIADIQPIPAATIRGWFETPAEEPQA